jgi:putative FmdB family regulatory protein
MDQTESPQRVPARAVERSESPLSLIVCKLNPRNQIESMPTYEYRCPACGHDFEKFQRMSDDPVAECPSCDANAVRRISAGAGLVFKGSGFYITDYRGDSYKKAAGADNGGEGKNDSGGEGKKDSGGEGKPDAGGAKSGSESAPATSSAPEAKPAKKAKED